MLLLPQPQTLGSNFVSDQFTGECNRTYACPHPKLNGEEDKKPGVAPVSLWARHKSVPMGVALLRRDGAHWRVHRRIITRIHAAKRG